ncbi:MAG: biopolymer transporter ExbD, partial [Puniceicoccales bacterium]|nr:biopolymer transporter ExbD [Puniceicoccales bacterium]
ISFMDLAYSLLIVFMLTTPLTYRHLKIQVPQTEKSRGASPRPLHHSVSLDESGSYFVHQLPLTWEELKAHFSAWSQTDPLPVVEIEADARLPYQKVAEVIDLLRQYRLKSVSLKVR